MFEILEVLLERLLILSGKETCLISGSFDYRGVGLTQIVSSLHGI